MKKIIILCFLCSHLNMMAGTMNGTIKQIIGDQTQVAEGTLVVGVVEGGQGSKLDVMKAVNNAYVENRVAQIGADGNVSMTSLPEGVPLYVSIFLYSGYGKFSQVTLYPGQVLDLSQIIQDPKIGGVEFHGKINWPPGITFKEKTSRMIYLSGKNNNWEYTSGAGEGEIFQMDNVLPGIYRLGIHSKLANGDDRYDEVEVTVVVGMPKPMVINIP